MYCICKHYRIQMMQAGDHFLVVIRSMSEVPMTMSFVSQLRLEILIHGSDTIVSRIAVKSCPYCELRVLRVMFRRRKALCRVGCFRDVDNADF